MLRRYAELKAQMPPGTFFASTQALVEIEMKLSETLSP